MRSALAAVVLTSSIPLSALAQDGGPTRSLAGDDESLAGSHGLELGVRVGFALALGNAGDGQPLSNVAIGNVPLQLDVGYRFNPTWFGGAYFQYGPAIIKDCGDTQSCSGQDLRFGLQGQYHFLPVGHAFDPWLGLGVGYEIFHTSVSAGSTAVSFDTHGIEFANLTLGGDLRFSPRFAIGPFLGISAGQYSSTGKADIQEKAVHFWASGGVRGLFDLL